MEKLSSILPSNSRVKSVDLEDAHPVRPGVPSLGRPMGTTSSQRDRMTISPQAKEAAFNETLAKRNPREDKSVQIAAKITDQFFNSRVGPKSDSDFVPTLSEQVSTIEVQTIPNYVADGTNAEQAPESGQLIDKNA